MERTDEKEQRETKNNEQSLIESTNIGRRSFIKTTGLAAIGLGAGLGTIRSFAQAPANPQGGAYPADFRKIHEELISIDGASPMLSWGMDTTGAVTDPSGKAFDYYIQGGVTAAPASVSTARLPMEIVLKAVAFFDILLSICVFTFALSEDMSLGNAVYLALITALSIGYGDIVPTTTVGRATSVIAGFTGVIFLGLMVAIATRAVSQSYEEKMRGENRPPST